MPAAPKRPRPALALSRADARAVVLAAQGIAPGTAAGGGLAEIVERHGFVRTLGGLEAYLALRARRPGLTRAEIERAVAERELLVRPTVRGCMYVVPPSAEALSLAVARHLTRANDERTEKRAGIRAGELDALGKAVVAVLAKQALSTDGVRKALPAGSVRSLGERGKKAGVSSTLPPALRRLEHDGAIERANEDGRLDQERYLWRLPPRTVRRRAARATDGSTLFLELAERYLRAAGFGAPDAFAVWAGCGKRDARATFERLSLLPVAVEGCDESFFALEERYALLAHPPDAGDAIAVLPFEDNTIALHGAPALLVDRAFHDFAVPTWGGGKPKSLGEANHLAYRSIVAGGQIAGFWELDPKSGRAVTALFATLPKKTAAKVAEAVDEVARFLVDSFGHAKSYSLDNEASLAERAAAIRKLA